jgi:hypothetical protein
MVIEVHAVTGEGDGRVVPVHHAMKTYWESGGIDPSILYRGTVWR